MHNSAFFHKMERWASLWAVRIGDVVFVDSESVRDFVLQTSKAIMERVAVISFVTAPVPASVPNYDFQRTRFVLVGRIHPVKNVPMAVRAIAWLHKHGVDAYLDVYGRDDGDGANVQQTILEMGLKEYISLKGELVSPDKERVLASTDYPFYLQLSRMEGMAMSVVESMQAGKVCVLTEVGEIPNYATDGESAVFVDYASSEKWEQTMHHVLSVITDTAYCRRISVAAHRVFQERPLFKDALVEAIRQERSGYA